MNDLAFFPNREHDHKEDSDSKSPDPEELLRLLGPLVDAIGPRARRSAQELRIRNFRSDKYQLLDDLIVFLEERGGGEYVATSYDTGQYGHGYSPDSALQNLCSVLEDYYELLLEDEGHLSQRLNAHLRYLRSILRVRE
jgi:predicted RNase H-like HicB family nuclease